MLSLDWMMTENYSKLKERVGEWRHWTRNLPRKSENQE